MQSLQKGNIQSVSIEKDGNVSKMFIETNPQYKTTTRYDSQMMWMQREELGQCHSVQQSQGKEVKQDQREEIKQDVKKGLKQKPGDDLDGPKKRVRIKKGCRFELIHRYPLTAGTGKLIPAFLTTFNL